MSLDIQAVTVDTPLPPLLEKRLSKIEARVGTTEAEGLLARWEFGRVLLEQRVGKKLPAHLLDRVAQTVGVSRQELGARMAFADRYRTEEELSDAIRKFPSWMAMSHEGLRRPKAERAPTATDGQLALRHAGRLAERFAGLTAEEIGEKERTAIQVLVAALTHVCHVGGINGND